MKKRIFMFAVLILSGLQFAVAAIDEQLRALITTSDDIEVTEVTNDEANPWTVADVMASSTVGKINQNLSSTITIKFRAKGRITIKYDFTFDPYSSSDYRKVYMDGNLDMNINTANKTLTTQTHFFDLDEGEHVLELTHYHFYYLSNSYSQVLSIGNIRFQNLDSQYMTINLSAPGTLGVEALALVNTLPDMRYLRLTGKMNAADWNTISNMTGLWAIDMKDVDITAIPASAFAKTSLRFIEFPAQLKTIGEKAFYERSLVGRLVLPESLDSIYSYAFYKNFLTEVIIPANVKYIGGYAFNDNDRLTSVTLGCGLTEISNYCFNSCEKLAVVKGGENVKTIESGAFNYCSELRSVSDLAPVTVGGSAFYCCKKLENFNFSNAKTLKSEAYRECNTLTDVDLTTVETIGTRCFITCTGLKKVVLGNNISRINEYAFTDCNALEELHIGSSVSNLDSRCFYTTSSSLKKVYVTAPAPPSVYNNTSYYPFYSTSGVTLYVPEYAMVSYKLDNYWSKFTKVEPNPNTPDKVNIYKKLELTSNARIPNSPDIYIGKGGSLIVNGDNAQAFGKYTQYMNIGETSSSLISRCKEMTSTSSQFDFFIGATSGYGYWYYLCMPFDVKRSDIILPEGTAIAVRYYDSESRATNGASGNWKDVSADAVLQTGKGYIFRSSKEGDVGFPATEETHNAIFRSEAITTPLVEYAAEESANAGWNLVGNPYPCFYDIYYMDFAAPITTWDVDNRTYKAYSATDDTFVLTPLQAFFVQKPSSRRADRSTRPSTTRLWLCAAQQAASRCSESW